MAKVKVGFLLSIPTTTTAAPDDGSLFSSFTYFRPGGHTLCFITFHFTRWLHGVMGASSECICTRASTWAFEMLGVMNG